MCAGSIDTKLAELATNDYLAIAVSRLHANNCPLIAAHQLFCFQNENIINFPIAMIVRKDFRMLPSINGFLQQVIEGGFVQKWKIDSQKYDFKLIGYKEPIVLAMENLLGAFLVLFLGMFLGCLAFVAENWMHSYMKSMQTDPNKTFWYTIERCIFIPERVYCLDK